MDILKGDTKVVRVDGRNLNCDGCKKLITSETAIKRRLKIKTDNTIKWQRDYWHESCAKLKGVVKEKGNC